MASLSPKREQQSAALLAPHLSAPSLFSSVDPTAASSFHFPNEQQKNTFLASPWRSLSPPVKGVAAPTSLAARPRYGPLLPSRQAAPPPPGRAVAPPWVSLPPTSRPPSSSSNSVARLPGAQSLLVFPRQLPSA
ncbi:hypothetical protein U9M48_024102 [Paspalum notatum var. saurae]|uniref:Uncharacterized protein n=1 Tax=Paspalum notatum var. saurae TaxID=547442 RepID=A0AAQ3TQN7_PASNO